MIGTISFCLLVLHTLHLPVFGDLNLTCPLGIRSFSKEARGKSYYLCEQEKKQAVLKTCGAGKIYWASKQACHDEENVANVGGGPDLVVYSRPTLGATVLLGDLYNSNTYEILTGYSLWKRSTVLTNRIRTASPGATVDIFATRSTIDRLQRTGLSSALSINILGDLIAIKGSSAYLKYILKSEKEVAVLLTFQATTQTETLPVSTPTDNDFCGENGPTHVITGVTYGIGANFVFKKRVQDDESVEKVTQDLQTAVNAIKTIKGDISEAIKQIVKDVRVDFYADFMPEKEPGNFEESVKMYQSLPSRVPKNTNNTVTTSIQLMPITRFCKSKKATHIAISREVLDSVNEMLNEIEKTKLTINTLQMKNAVQLYLPLKKILQTLYKELTRFELNMKTALKDILPRIRRGNVSEEGLVLLLNKYTASPFNYDNIEAFLDNRRREINMLDYIISPTKFEGTDINVVNYRQAIDIRTMFIKPFVLMVRYNILPSKVIVHKFLKGEEIYEDKAWYNNPHVISEMGMALNKFVKFSSSNKKSESCGYLLAVADAHDGVHFIDVNAQKEGSLYVFTFPELPPTMTSIANTHNSITFTIKRPSSTWISGFRITYESQADKISKSYKFSKENETIMKIDELMVNTAYHVSLQYITPMGASPPSPSSYFSTRSSSSPTNLRTTMVASDYFIIYWDPPSTCGKSMHIRKYKVTVTGDKQFFRTMIVHGATNVEIKRLQAASVYNVAIQAIAERASLNVTDRTPVVDTSLPSTLSIITRPDAPSYLSLVKRSVHACVVVWAPTSKVAVGAVVQKYQLKYGVTNNIGDLHRSGTEIVVSSRNTSYHMTDLIQGTTYSISVKVLTTKGDSDYSPSLIIRTMYKRSELDELRDALNHNVTEFTKKIKAVDERVDSNKDNINYVTNNSLFMVYYPRLRAEGRLVDRLSSCGGTINKAGELAYPSLYWTEYQYRGGEECKWNIRTGTQTTLNFNGFYMKGGDYVNVYDEEKLIGRYSGTSTFSLTTYSGNAFVDISTNQNTDVYYGFRLMISETPVTRIAGRRYYSEYEATFRGYGSPSSYLEHYTWKTLSKTNSSIPACIKDCKDRFVRDNSWNELSIELNSDPLTCTCYKNATGFTYSFSQFHYRIV